VKNHVTQKNQSKTFCAAATITDGNFLLGSAKPLIPELEKEVWIDHKYRVDFFIPSQKVIVELYGYEYHKTKQKITRDAERARYLQRLGFQVVGFTGPEVFRDVQKCINEVLSLPKVQSAKAMQPSPSELLSYSDKGNRPQIESVSSPTAYLGTSAALAPLSSRSALIVKKRKKVFGMEAWQLIVLGLLLTGIILILLCIPSMLPKANLLF